MYGLGNRAEAGRPRDGSQGISGALQCPQPISTQLCPLLWLGSPGGTEEPDFCTSTLGTKPWAGTKCVLSKPLLGK